VKAFKGHRPFAVLVILLFCASLASISAVKLTLTSPKDKTITEATTLMVNGQLDGAKSITINGMKINPTGRNLEAMAILNPGKNLMNIDVTGTGGDRVSKSLRVIRVIAFDDLKQLFGLREHWAKKQVIALATLGIIEGYADNNFKPEDPMTRGEFATWLARAKGLKLAKPSKDLYFDVPKEHWRAPFIKAVVDAGIMGGTSQNVFGIETPLKRSEAVRIMAKAYNIAAAGAVSSPFSDVNSDTTNSKAIISAYKSGLVVGTSRWKRSFDPERDIKRAEAAVLISRLGKIKTMIAALYDFSQGFSSLNLCRINTRPIIKKAFITPKEVINNGANNVKVSLYVMDEQGRGDISQVWADLTDLGGPLNAKMNVQKDFSYGLSFSVSGEAKPGQKKVNIYAMDRSGLKANTVLNLNILGK